MLNFDNYLPLHFEFKLLKVNFHFDSEVHATQMNKIIIF